MIKNMLWLRVVMILGACSEIVYNYYYFESKPQWSPIIWCIVWILVNAFQLAILIKDRMNLKLTEEEEKIYNLSFPKLSKVEFNKLIKSAKWTESEPGTVLVEEGAVISRLIVIFSGIAEIRMNNEIVAYIRDGNFIGEMSFITGNVTTAQVVCFTNCRYLYWDKSLLMNLIGKHHEIEEGLKSSFNMDLVNKLVKKA